jgi:hypothetical protein
MLMGKQGAFCYVETFRDAEKVGKQVVIFIRAGDQNRNTYGEWYK